MDEAQITDGRIAVRVSLFADLRHFAPPGSVGAQHVELTQGASVLDLLQALQIPAYTEMTVGCNKELAHLDTVLHDGDDVVLFSPMTGG